MSGYNRFNYNALDALDKNNITPLQIPAMLNPTPTPGVGSNGLMSAPLVDNGIPSPPNDKLFGMHKDALSSMLASISGAIAPTIYGKNGQKIDTWQKKLADVLTSQFQAKQASNSLIPQTNAGQLSPAQLMKIAQLYMGGQ